MTKPPLPSAAFPSREAVLSFIRSSTAPVGKREIARAFRLSGSAGREWLKDLLKELEADGAVERGRGKRLAPPDALPAVGVLEITGIDTDGEVMARPLTWTADVPPPRIVLTGEAKGHPALTPGDRALCKLSRVTDGLYEARLIRRIDGSAGRVLGVFRRTADGGRLIPTDRRAKGELAVLPLNIGDARDGDLVLADILPAARLGLPQARIADVIGPTAEPRAASLIAIHANGIPTVFPPAAEAQVARAKVPGLGTRADLRSVPLVTIDGADARDYDDAVWAEADPDPANPGGWHLLVAIADVAYYVRPGDPLDRAAFERGNSTYFPDRVVPMLPEALSNGLCSLVPGEDRGCLAAELWIDAKGRILRHRFVRGLMRSAARLTYEQVQAARDGAPDDITGPLADTVLAPLYSTFACLWAARGRRGTLELDLPERLVRLGEDGRITAIAPRERLDSHRLIEEFMIAANVAAAESLEQAGVPALYRVHDQPSLDKMESLREFLNGIGYALPRAAEVTPSLFTGILARAHGRPEAELVSEVILRAQAQAIYSPENLGHFGLALKRYAHFTSPIRRYADLLIHRGLIRAHGLGPGGLSDEEMAGLEAAGEHVSLTERRSATAERDALDRYTAAYLSERLGVRLSGRITGVTRFGLFIRLAESGGDGLVPASTLPDDRYEHREHEHALVGERHGRVYRLGAPVTVTVAEADPLTGSTLFRLDAPDGADGLNGGGSWQSGNAPAAGRRETKKSSKGKHRGRKATSRGK